MHLNYYILCTAALFYIPTAVAVVGQTDRRGPPDDVANHFIIRFKNQQAADGAAQTIQQEGVNDKSSKLKYKFDKALPRGIAAFLSPGTLAKLRQKYKDDIEYVEPEQVYTISVQAPSGSWGLERTSADTPTNTGKYYYPDAAGGGAYVYVLDTGIETRHTAFGKNGRVFNNGTVISGALADDNGHGTHCAGTIGASINNYGTTKDKQLGIANKVTIVGYKVLNSRGSGSTSGIVAAINSVTAVKLDHPERKMIISMSLGGGLSTALNTAVENAVAAGIVVTVAAGNENQDVRNVSPASAPNAITVGATDKTDTRASFSNYGAGVDIFAPGVDITSLTIPRKGKFTDGYTETWSGTSMATPHVAGVAALLMVQYNLNTPAEVRAKLVELQKTGIVKLANSANNNLLNNGARA